MDTSICTLEVPRHHRFQLRVSFIMPIGVPFAGLVSVLLVVSPSIVASLRSLSLVVALSPVLLSSILSSPVLVVSATGGLLGLPNSWVRASLRLGHGLALLVLGYVPLLA